MNEDMQYKAMLDMPINSCNITFKPMKKRKKRSPEHVKAQLIEKINQTNEEKENVENLTITKEENEQLLKQESVKPKKERSPLIRIEFAIIGLLMLTICLTNVFIENSAINTFFGKVFKSESVSVVDERSFDNFTPVFSASNSETALENGITTISKKGSVYSSLEGEIFSISKKENGKYDVEVKHSENFMSVYSGLDFVYLNENDKVFSNIPLGYLKGDNYTVCFYDGENIITDYQINEGTVVWAV